jgi:heme-degrading monooxygenase HmoA
MSEKGELYTSAQWVVKEGKEKEFIEAWQAYIADGSKKFGVTGARMLQDAEISKRFVSFGRWENADKIAEWRSSPEFKNFMAKANELCDLAEPRNYKVVASQD